MESRALIEENDVSRMIFKLKSSLPVDVGLHNYRRYRLGYILHGEKRFIFDDRSIVGSEGELFFIPLGYYHVENLAPAYGGDYEEILFSFSSSELVSILSSRLLGALFDSFALSDNEDLDENEEPFVAVPSNITRDVFHAIDTRYNQGGFSGNTFVEQINLTNVITSIFEHDPLLYRRTFLWVLNQEQTHFERVIYDNIFTDRRLEDLADELHRSLTTFKKEFRRLFDCSPHSWFLSQRMRYAKSMLAITNDSITKIATRCNINNSSHFIKIYKSHYGMTPAQHRKLLRGYK